MDMNYEYVVFTPEYKTKVKYNTYNKIYYHSFWYKWNDYVSRPAGSTGLSISFKLASPNAESKLWL